MALDPAVVDEQVRRAVAWHFGPETGSPYWLAKAREWGLDAVRDLRGLQDLLRLPAMADDLRRVPARDLIPRGCLQGDFGFGVWESGGTTGLPRRVVDAHDRAGAMARMEETLAAHGFPAGPTGDWLHLGPTGPHLVGRSVQRLAARRQALCHYIDLDPRWVKVLAAGAGQSGLAAYMKHLNKQAVDILATQPVEVLATTPPLLSALCLDSAGLALLQQRLRAVIWFGTSASAETVRQWQALLPGVTIVGWYGNTLAGIAVQRPHRAGDAQPVVFVPPWPDAYYTVVDPADPAREVAVGQGGQVRITVLGRESFLPHHLERDWALRVAGEPGEPDGLAGVRPLQIAGGARLVEGVY